MILLNPHAQARPYADDRSAEVMRQTIAFFETKGKDELLADYYDRVWYARLPRLREGEPHLRDHVHAGRRGRRRRTLGHVAHLRVRRDPRLLRPPILVHLAGLGARPRSDLDEQERGDPAPRRAGARGRRHLRLRPVGEGARRRHLLDRHGAEAGRRRLARQRPQVLHRERQRGGDRLDVRPHRRNRGLRLLRRRSAPPGLPPHQERRREPELRLRVRAARLSGHPGRHPAPRPRRLGRRAQYREHRQVQPRLGVHRHLHPRPLRGDHPRLEPRPLQDARDRLPARAPELRRRLLPPRRHEALCAARRRLHARSPPPRTVATSCTTRW